MPPHDYYFIIMYVFAMHLHAMTCQCLFVFAERYNLAFKIVRTESRLVRGILLNHGFHEVQQHKLLTLNHLSLAVINFTNIFSEALEFISASVVCDRLPNVLILICEES